MKVLLFLKHGEIARFCGLVILLLRKSTAESLSFREFISGEVMF